MMIDGSALLALLARGPEAEAVIERLEGAASPLFTTPLALLVATEGLARAKAGADGVTPALLRAAGEVVADCAAALGLREVPITSELGRRAADRLGEDGMDPARALSAAAARLYRVPLLVAADLPGPHHARPA